MAPLISATVMMANVSWKAEKTSAVRLGGGGDQALQPDLLDATDDLVQRVVAVRAEREGVPVEDPGHADRDDADERHHHHVEHALGPGHAPVEERQAWRHQQDERGGRDHPRCRTGIDLHLGESPP
jgi:hypothetical protein